MYPGIHRRQQNRQFLAAGFDERRHQCFLEIFAQSYQPGSPVETKVPVKFDPEVTAWSVTATFLNSGFS